MRVHIIPSVASGCIQAPASKSLLHRYLLCAALAKGESLVRHVTPCDDVKATVRCLEKMGAIFSWEKDEIRIQGMEFPKISKQAKLQCGASASTLRFLLPIAMLQSEKVTFCFDSSLAERPMDVYETLCYKHGYFYQKKGHSITVCGPLHADTYNIPGNISSQFVTGMLFALSLVEGNSFIHLTTPLESASYVKMTMEVLQKAGVQLAWHEDTITIFGGQKYASGVYDVEADASAAANLYALNLLGGDVVVENMTQTSLQGDAVFPKLFDQLLVGHSKIDLENCPDLGPILMAMASANEGATFSHVQRLQYKESDRLLSMQQELKKLGIEMVPGDDECTIVSPEIKAPVVDLSSHNDHRIAMALAVLLTECGGYLQGAEAVSKSYPYFFDDLRQIGIVVLEE